MEYYVTQPKDYWIALQAIKITLNALGNPNRMQGSVASGAAILCYIEGVAGLGYDNGHRFKTWPLSISPTYFNSNTAKYVYVAIPRSTSVGTQAVVGSQPYVYQFRRQNSMGEGVYYLYSDDTPNTNHILFRRTDYLVQKHITHKRTEAIVLRAHPVSDVTAVVVSIKQVSKLAFGKKRVKTRIIRIQTGQRLDETVNAKLK